MRLRGVTEVTFRSRRSTSRALDVWTVVQVKVIVKIVGSNKSIWPVPFYTYSGYADLARNFEAVLATF